MRTEGDPMAVSRVGPRPRCCDVPACCNSIPPSQDSLLPEAGEAVRCKFLLDQVAQRVGDVRTSTIGLVDGACDVAGHIGFPDDLLQVLRESRNSRRSPRG